MLIKLTLLCIFDEKYIKILINVLPKYNKENGCLC